MRTARPASFRLDGPRPPTAQHPTAAEVAITRSRPCPYDPRPARASRAAAPPQAARTAASIRTRFEVGVAEDDLPPQKP